MSGIIAIHTNPAGELDLSQDQCLQLCGLLPPWIIAAIKQDEKSVWDHLADEYGMGMYEIEKATITDEGIWQYPEDEDLPPVAEFKGNDKVVYVYQYGMVAIKEKDSNQFKCTRMD